MASASWNDISKYIEGAYNVTGAVDRQLALEMAFNEQAPDGVIDALDGLGSKLFPTPEAARDYLISKGYISPGEKEPI